MVNVNRSAKVIPFRSKTSSARNVAYDFVTLESWLRHNTDEEDIREVFLNMDRAMKYVHDHGYCVKSFHPREIGIINGELDQIRFNTLLEMPFDPVKCQQYIKEDIYNSAFLQIGIYTKCLYSMKRDFLKSKFEKEFAQYLPSGDVPYYRGVIERGASVYFCEYDLEKRKRDLVELEKEVGGESTPADKSALSEVDVNEEINSVIYRQISKRNDAAFVDFLVYPTMILAISLIIALLVRLLSI